MCNGEVLTTPSLSLQPRQRRQPQQDYQQPNDEIDFELSQAAKDKIRVAVRKRPVNRKEKAKGDVDVVTVLGNDQSIVVHEPKQKVDLTKYVESHRFMFDEVFSEEANNEQIYQRTCRPLVDFCFEKGKATCFAYGQTGSGKTFTMMGPEGGQGKQAGMYVLAAEDIFKGVSVLATNPFLLFLCVFMMCHSLTPDPPTDQHEAILAPDCVGLFL